MRVLVLRLWRKWFGGEVAEVEEAAEQFRASPAGKRADRKTIWVLVAAAVALTGQNFWDDYVPVIKIGARLGVPWELADLLGFALGCLFWYLVPAILVIKAVFRERIVDYGVKMAGWSTGWRIYMLFVAVMVPLVFFFSMSSEFQRIYPFYRGWRPELDGWGRLLAWEVAYALQFVALEFFFRGFMVHGLKHRFGVYSVFVMTVPYCMIHFGKALPECLASIIAGVALGLMSLKTRSVWLGAALHISVAWGMDGCSLWRKGLMG